MPSENSDRITRKPPRTKRFDIPKHVLEERARGEHRDRIVDIYDHQGLDAAIKAITENPQF